MFHCHYKKITLNFYGTKHNPVTVPYRMVQCSDNDDDNTNYYTFSSLTLF